MMKQNVVYKNVVNKIIKWQKNVKLFLKLKIRNAFRKIHVSISVFQSFCISSIKSWFVSLKKNMDARLALNEKSDFSCKADKKQNGEAENNKQVEFEQAKNNQTVNEQVGTDQVENTQLENKQDKNGQIFLEKQVDSLKNLEHLLTRIREKAVSCWDFVRQKWTEAGCDSYFSEIKKDPLLAKLNMRSPMLIMLTLTGLFFFCIFGFIYFKSIMINKMLRSNAEPPVTVSAIKAENQSWEPKFKAPGSLRAIKGIDVTTEIAGMVKSIEFTPGSEVNAGDVLVRLNADAEIAELHALEAQAELAKITFERDKLQYAIKAISKETLDIASSDLNNKNALVAQQAATLAKKTITAPFKGRLGISTMNLGQYLNAGDKVVTLQTFDPIYFDFYVPQQIIHTVEVGKLVSITSDAIPGLVINGKITTIDPKADPQTRNIQVEATLPNENSRLLPGMFARAEVSIGLPEQHLTLPQTAISFNPYGELIYLITEKEKNKDGKPVLSVKQSFVTVGASRGDQVAILKGLKEGDMIVTSGQNKLKNGSIVLIDNSISPPNNASVNFVNQ